MATQLSVEVSIVCPPCRTPKALALSRFDKRSSTIIIPWENVSAELMCHTDSVDSGLDFSHSCISVTLDCTTPWPWLAHTTLHTCILWTQEFLQFFLFDPMWFWVPLLNVGWFYPIMGGIIFSAIAFNYNPVCSQVIVWTLMKLFVLLWGGHNFVDGFSKWSISLPYDIWHWVTLKGQINVIGCSLGRVS